MLIAILLVACSSGAPVVVEPTPVAGSSAAKIQPTTASQPTTPATIAPTVEPTVVPTATVEPTVAPTPEPTAIPTPTLAPTPLPTYTPPPTPTPTARVIVVTPTPTPTTSPLISASSNYVLTIGGGSEFYYGKTITFRIGGNKATETGTWEQGGATNMNLTAFSGQSRQSSGGYQSTMVGFAAQRVPPHVFIGTAYLDGKLPSKGTIVSAWIDGAWVAETRVADVSVANTNNSTSAMFQSLGGNLKTVWRFKNLTKAWEFYVPREAFLEVNTFPDATSGDIVYVNVTADTTFQALALFEGWNLILLD